MNLRTIVFLMLGLSLCPGIPSVAMGEKLYRYQNPDGGLVFTDKPGNNGTLLSVEQVQVPAYRGRFSLQKNGPDDNAVLRGINAYFGPVQVEITLDEHRNIVTEPPLPAHFLLPPRKERNLVRLHPDKINKGFSYRYGYRVTPGDPSATHSHPDAYRLPIPPGKTFIISQAFKGKTSHSGPKNRYAVDIAMPVGTPVHAARGGIVMDVATDYFSGGMDWREYGQRANFIRILHDDGTMAIYAHLKLETVQFAPGTRVKKGDVIALSGNTGFSSGPHLHFVIQKNANSTLKSVPFRFIGPDGQPFTPKKGQHVHCR